MSGGEDVCRVFHTPRDLQRLHLQDLILQMTGKTVEVEMLLKKTNMHQDLAEISVDDILKQTVHMNIVVEEEPEDE